ncbi:MAG: hypothetical protein EHM23_32370 [Acidobacteria bacterium]|nr:MAG: hypothetical protein EHM23_32370 [Acidobacteriota bacterium]
MWNKKSLSYREVSLALVHQTNGPIAVRVRALAKGMAALLLSVVVNVPDARPQTGGHGGHLAVRSTLRDILHHPLS